MKTAIAIIYFAIILYISTPATCKKTTSNTHSHTKEIPICGEGYKGLLNYQFDRNDPDALIVVAAFLSKNILNLYTGNVNYKKIDLSNSITPLETLSANCFAIRNQSSLPDVLCASGLLERNEWINAIDSSMLCEITGVKSKLPLIPGEEILEEIDEEKPKGVNLFIHDGPNGKPDIYINGKTTKQIEKEREEQSLNSTTAEPTDDLSHLFPNYESNTQTDVKDEPPIDKYALNEARAEAGLLTNDIPDRGYYKTQL